MDVTVALNGGGSSVKGIGYLNAAASSPRRFEILCWKIGSAASPADNAALHLIQRATTAPTGSARTPQAKNPADTLASTVVANDTITVDGTITAGAVMDSIPLNQRQTLIEYAKDNRGIVAPATASNGFLFGFAAAQTATFGYDVDFDEK